MTHSWYDPGADEVIEFDVPAPELWESENPIVGMLFGPDGKVLSEIRSRPSARFGYAPRR